MLRGVAGRWHCFVDFHRPIKIFLRTRVFSLLIDKLCQYAFVGPLTSYFAYLRKNWRSP